MRQTQRGFTMIETLTVMAVAASLTLAAVPSLTHTVQRQQLTSAVNELNLAISLGRSEAMARGQRVALAALSGNDWRTGWQLYVDKNNNGQQDPGEDTLRVFEPVPGHLEFRAWGAQASATMSFTSDGFIRRAGRDGQGRGLALGGIAISTGSQVRTICFGATRTRVTSASSCG